MKDIFKGVEKFLRTISRKREPEKDELKLQGVFNVEHWRDGKMLSRTKVPNMIMNAAKNVLWDTMFNAFAQTGASAWRMSLVSSAGFSAIAATDTMAAHAGWTEFVDYSGGTRPAWGQGAAASQAITNGSAITFTATGAGTAKGLFICNQSTLGGATGLLWCAGLFTAGDAMLNIADELRVTYSAGA